MSREWKIYLRDMVVCCDRILAYTEGVNREVFNQRGMVFDATVRNLELLGEAARQVPEEVRGRAPEIEWRRHKLLEYNRHDCLALRHIVLRASREMESWRGYEKTRFRLSE